MYLCSDYDGRPERARILGKALLDPGDGRVGAQLEEEDCCRGC